ncbi:hypothetical protein DFH07DRAFT_759734 [Mycena maculata]|uniref:Uncharacterized protein n=1 Tax=Mycena maculata TaxID=230809 RepID=A0AAD7HKS2_9AGAR|nr:hypothetical protein DFH07DRAFT_759734 [Mycena maculata]
MDGHDSEYYPAQPNDVFEVRHVLVKFLPAELVNTILDDAQYWPRIRASRDILVTVNAARSTNNDAALCYLVTPQFPSRETLGGPGARLRVKCVKFRILSNDQGWSSAPQFHGTYNGSYTWFEAAILRPGPRPELQGWRRWALAMGSTRFLPSRPLIEVKNPHEEGGRWLIQRNRCASKEPLLHTVVWVPGRAEAKPEEEERGRGHGSGFTDLLDPEDRIGIVARAMYPGWINCIRSVEVVVYYAV